MGEELKKLKAKVIHKHETAANWELSSYIPDIGEVVFYDPDEEYNYTRHKNGDGIRTVHELPFATINLVNGEGTKSAKLDSGEGQKALSRYNASFGEESIAGILGYHFSNIDFENKIITLNDSTDKQSSVPTAETNYVNPKQFSVNWSVGDVICIINSSKYDLCSTITAINNNQITVNEFPFTKVNSMSAASIDYDDYSVFNPNAPTEGIVDLAPAAFVSGVENLSAGAGTHTEGKQNKSIGHYAHTEGRKTIATYNAHAEGYKTEARGQGTHTEGHETKGKGKAVHAEGYQTKALADYAHSEGVKTEATAESSHAEGNATQATARGTHSEGVLTKATNEAAHSEGRETEANGPYSHAGGLKAKAEGTCSFAHGNTVVAQAGQSVFGANNEINPEALAQWGNGTTVNPSNAFEILKDGSFNYKDPIEGYANSTDVRKKTAKVISDNYNHYQNTLKSNIDCNFELTRKEDLASLTIWDYYPEEQFISRDTNDYYYDNLNNRGELYNISSNLVIKENRGYNQNHGLKFNFRDDGGIYITGVLDKEPDTQYVQFSLLDTSGEKTSLTKELIKAFIQHTNEKTLYLKLKSQNPAGTLLQISYKLTPENTTQYFNVKDNEVKFIELNENSELYSIYLQINVSDTENGTEFNTLVYPYVSFGKEANERGQILTIPTEYNSYWALLKEGFLYCTELEPVSFYKSKIATKEEVNTKAPAIHEHEIEDVNGLQEIVEQISNENNSFTQKGNEAIGEQSAAFGNGNKVFSKNAFAEGLLNLAGVKLNNEFVLDMVSASTYTAEDGERYTKIVLNSQTGLPDLSAGVPVIIYANGLYYSCRFYQLVSNEIYFLNHNASSGIKSAINKGLSNEIKFYKIDEASIAENTHTEHVEGAYNIVAEIGAGAKSGKVNHIEGHTNISFGQYNHLEGIQNRALGQTEFSHMEGRMNVIDPGEGKAGTVTVGGEGNTIGVSAYTHVHGYGNILNEVRMSGVDGQSNTLENVKHTNVGGNQNLVSDISSAIVHGSNLKASSNNKAVFGQFNEEDGSAILIVGNGSTDNYRKTVFKIDKNGYLKYLNEQKQLVDLNSTLSNMKEAISTITSINNEVTNHTERIEACEHDIMLNNKQLTETVSITDSIYYPTQGLFTIKETNVPITIEACSRNILDKNYYRKSSSTTGLQLKVDSETGVVTVSGTWTSGWPQLTIYDTAKPFKLVPGTTYTLGRISEDDIGIEFRLTYINEQGASTWISAKNGKTAEQTFTWKEDYTFVSLMIQALQKDYTEIATVYPYIYIEGREPKEWIPNNISVYSAQPGVSNLDIIDTTNEQDGYIAITNLSSSGESHNLLLDKYVEKYSTKEELTTLEQKFTEAFNNYKIKVVEDGEEGTDENTLYFILE